MAAKSNSFGKVQRNLRRIAAILTSTVCEWILIFLLLLYAAFSYVLIKFSHYCKLQTPCILCSRLDHVFGNNKPENYQNLLCSNHRLEISSLIYCPVHDKLADGMDMCEDCLCSFSTKNKSGSDCHGLFVGKLRFDFGGTGFQSPFLNRSYANGFGGARVCSCCSKPWGSKKNGSRLLQLKSSGNSVIKSNIPLPCLTRNNRFNSRDKVSVSESTSHYLGKSRLDRLSHVGYSKLTLNSDSESEVLLSDEDDVDCEENKSKDDRVKYVPVFPRTVGVNDHEPEKSYGRSIECMPSLVDPFVPSDGQEVPPHEMNYVASFDQADQKVKNTCSFPKLISLDDPPSTVGTSLKKSEVTRLCDTESVLIKMKQEDVLRITSSISRGFQSELSDSSGSVQEDVSRATTRRISQGCQTEPFDTENRSIEKHEDVSRMTSMISRECQADQVVHEPAIVVKENYPTNREVKETVKEQEISCSDVKQIGKDVKETVEEQETSGSAVKQSEGVKESVKEQDIPISTEKQIDRDVNGPVKEWEISSFDGKQIAIDVEETVKEQDISTSSVNQIGRDVKETVKEQNISTSSVKQNKDVKETVKEQEMPSSTVKEVDRDVKGIGEEREIPGSSDEEVDRDVKEMVKEIASFAVKEIDITTPTPNKEIIISSSNSNAKTRIEGLEKTVSDASSLESFDGYGSDIEGENIVDRLKRKIENQKKYISSLYKELEEERNAADSAANEAMAMITRLQEEKAALHMEALQYLRLMEEQAEYDVDALEKANDLLDQKEKLIQDLEAELEFYRLNSGDVIMENTYEEENVGLEKKTSESSKKDDPDISSDPMINEVSKGSNGVLVSEPPSLEFEDEKFYIQQCLKGLARKLFEMSNKVKEQSEGKKVDIVSRSKDSSLSNGRANMGEKERQIASENGDHVVGEEVDGSLDLEEYYSMRDIDHDLLSLESEIVDLHDRLEALESDHDFLEHIVNSLHNGDEGIRFIQEIALQLQELRKIQIGLRSQSCPC